MGFATELEHTAMVKLKSKEKNNLCNVAFYKLYSRKNYEVFHSGFSTSKNNFVNIGWLIEKNSQTIFELTES